MRPARAPPGVEAPKRERLRDDSPVDPGIRNCATSACSPASTLPPARVQDCGDGRKSAGRGLELKPETAGSGSESGGPAGQQGAGVRAGADPGPGEVADNPVQCAASAARREIVGQGKTPCEFCRNNQGLPRTEPRRRGHRHRPVCACPTGRRHRHASARVRRGDRHRTAVPGCRRRPTCPPVRRRAG